MAVILLTHRSQSEVDRTAWLTAWTASAVETTMLSLMRRSSTSWDLNLSRLFSSERLDGLVYDTHGPPSSVLTLQRTFLPALQPHQVLVDFIAVCQQNLTKLVLASLEPM